MSELLSCQKQCWRMHGRVAPRAERRRSGRTPLNRVGVIGVGWGHAIGESMVRDLSNDGARMTVAPEFGDSRRLRTAGCRRPPAAGARAGSCAAAGARSRCASPPERRQAPPRRPAPADPPRLTRIAAGGSHYLGLFPVFFPQPIALILGVPGATPAMAINGRRNKPFGPGGSTRRLHPSPHPTLPRKREGIKGGGLRWGRNRIDEGVKDVLLLGMVPPLSGQLYSCQRQLCSGCSGCVSGLTNQA